MDICRAFHLIFLLARQNVTYLHHQWIEGNLPVASKCVVCDKTCGSVLRYVKRSAVTVTAAKVAVMYSDSPL